MWKNTSFRWILDFFPSLRAPISAVLYAEARSTTVVLDPTARPTFDSNFSVGAWMVPRVEDGREMEVVGWGRVEVEWGMKGWGI